MALPALQSLKDCADYSQIIEPFYPQLYELPSTILSTVKNGESLVSLYADTNPFIGGLAFSIFLGFIVWGVSEYNRNYSQVDRLWSILPTFYVAHFAAWTHLNNLPSQRVDLVLFWSVIWSVRLTFNYWRKGGYEVGSEDYRWEIIRAQCHPVIFSIFNATFISFIQNVLLYLLAAPTYIILLASNIEPTIGAGDIIFTITELALVLSEWFSDNQQWDYQAAKKKFRETAKVPRDSGFTEEDLTRGFIVSGLWAYCRHPNFTAEQTIWLVLYLWSSYAGNVLYSWACWGSLFLVLLFRGSTSLTEKITAGKYPTYTDYQKHVGGLIPTFQAYKPVAATPKIIRTSDLSKREKAKQK
ncbi:hypothetical protein F5Y12DRAFT_739538 [Xylaria sp. FL1777]|nr:hypothetical protein F5Y12DRAFT_739538 [Xylaria sp. FL1777]